MKHIIELDGRKFTVTDADVPATEEDHEWADVDITDHLTGQKMRSWIEIAGGIEDPGSGFCEDLGVLYRHVAGRYADVPFKVLP